MQALRVQAMHQKPMHPKPAHVAKGHRWSSRLPLLGCHGGRNLELQDVAKALNWVLCMRTKIEDPAPDQREDTASMRGGWLRAVRKRYSHQGEADHYRQ